ncbi:polygalacturonase inhibitor-like [Cucurbita moschata]|uniref:Polygalacturonase inhibitor-like n=1 Tax=Cucurbita moschata TaxID=3662 RepID=A0A6J1EB58_CUCMO|nr:polygalacturonase inhibitor-like [Cucurbita moschata]
MLVLTLKSPLPLLFFFLFFTISFAELCNPNDKKALLNIKKAFNNAYYFASWKPEEDCCTWYSVECDENSHRIISLDISTDNEISGQIPPYVGDLPFLQSLMLHKLPNLVGPIQPALAKLHNLKHLDISWTNISGTIPDFLSSLTKLTYIRLSFSNLSGAIPSSLSKLPNLKFLQLDRSKLTGQIPYSFGDFKAKGFYLYLSHNKLSGKIPPSLSRVDFESVDLSRNKLEGDASMIFGVHRHTWKVDLSRNLLEFDMSKVVFSTSLFMLDLNHNKIYGGLPPQMTKLSNLNSFNVSYNRLCGQIPKGGELQRFDVYSYFHNKCLCGAPLESCK